MRLQRVLVAAVTAVSGVGLSACGQLQLGPPSSWDQFLQAADTAVSQKKFDEAEKDCQEAVDDAEKKHADDPTIFVIAASHYAEIETGRGKYKEAEQLYRRALKLVEQHLPPDNPETLKLEKALAQVLTKEGKEKEAKQMLSNRVKLIQKANKEKAKQEAASRKESSESKRSQR
jgi:tetratricopeptide (TPR) repeat protein